MKKIIKVFFIFNVILYLIPQLVSGIVFDRGMETILMTALALTGSFLLVKPIINMLLLPINLLTFGLLRWASSAITLYLVTLIVDGFKITKFYFPGLSTDWFDIPVLNFHGILAFISFSFMISILYSIIHWIIK